MGKIENEPTWICDRCKTQHTGKSYPKTSDDAWEILQIDQDAAFDHHGCSWVPMMSKPLLLCGKCIDQVVKSFHDQTIGLSVTDLPGAIPEKVK